MSDRELVADDAGDALEYAGPVAGCSLPEEAHRRVPGAKIAIDKPAPLGDRRQGDEHPCSQRTRQVCQRCVRRHHEIQFVDHGGRVEEIASIFVTVVWVGQFGYAKQPCQRDKLFSSVPFLQADETHTGQSGEMGEVGQPKGAPAVDLVVAISLPCDPDVESTETFCWYRSCQLALRARLLVRRPAANLGP